MTLPRTGIGTQSWVQSPVQALGSPGQQVVDENVERATRSGSEDRTPGGLHNSDDRGQKECHLLSKVMTLVASTRAAPIATKRSRTGRPLCSICPLYYER